ncbi:MAG: discoidin domain-containing protein, partial [Bdellovibrionales bacterium]|nr:discoidin domain-containing protein [Bdellovibrionales bacterium]
NPVPDTSGNILGVIDGISPLGDISGWACEHGASRSIDIHVYAGGPAGSGTFIVAAKADLPSEQPVASACGDPTLTPHRFQFRVPTSVPASNYVGKKIYVHGINNRGNDLLVNSGNFTFIGQETSPQQPPVNNPPQNPPAGKKIYKLQDAAAKTELWPASYLLDDNKYSCYSSNPGDMNNSQGEFIAAWFNLGSIVTIDKVMITPRIVDGKTIGFPSSFRLYVTTPDNLSWMLVRDFNKTDLPKDANGDYLLQLPQSYQTWGIHIVPNQLGTDDFNHYYFQLCGLKAGYL